MNENLQVELINATLAIDHRKEPGPLAAAEIDAQGAGKIASGVREIIDDAERAIYYLSREHKDVKGREIVSAVDEANEY